MTPGWLDILVLPMDALCFREWARLMNGQPDDLLEDIMIAATTRVHELMLTTRHERHFAALGVRIFNPFKAAR
jgi:predicted nucleic acid-binding protein